jgi:hypothetical protein
MTIEFQPRWENPRPSLRGSPGSHKPKGVQTPRAEFWDLAETRPGEWLLVKIDSKVSSGQRKKWLRSHGFEVVARKNENGTYNLYVRYVGSTDDN